jgi:hypothetical protein
MNLTDIRSYILNISPAKSFSRFKTITLVLKRVANLKYLFYKVYTEGISEKLLKLEFIVTSC